MITTATIVSIVLALVAAALFGCASALQQREANRVSTGTPLLTTLIRTPRWWLGVGCDLGGFGVQATALAIGPLLVVQPLMILSLLFALPLAARWAGTTVARSTWLLAAALVIGLAGFLIIGRPQVGLDDAPFPDWLLPGGLVLAGALVAVLVAVLLRARPHRAAMALGVAVGLLFGITTVLIKPVAGTFGSGRRFWADLGIVLGGWQLWTLAVCGVIAVYLQQRAFHLGSLIDSLPAVTVADPIVGAVFGATVLRETIRLSGVGGVLVLGCVLVMLVTTVLLARQSATAGSVPSE